VGFSCTKNAANPLLTIHAFTHSRIKDSFSWGFKPQLKLRSQCRGEAALREVRPVLQEGFPPQRPWRTRRGFPRAGSAERVSRLETSGVLRIDVGVLYRFHMKMHRKNPTACGTSPLQGEVRRGKNNMQLHRELVLDPLIYDKYLSSR
jgi:hypothetical protein